MIIRSLETELRTTTWLQMAFGCDMYLNYQLLESTEKEMSSETQTAKEVIEGALSSDDTYSPLLLLILNANERTFSLDIARLMSRELFGCMTLRTLMSICTACNKKPSAPMLAVALQNSLPSLTGLPMDNPDHYFYIDIAKRFFGPANLQIRIRTTMYNTLTPDRFMVAYARDRNIETPQGGFSSWIEYYVHLILYSRELVHTKKGRDFAKSIVLEWLQTPLDEDMVKVYNHLINVLDHGLVLRHRHLVPGWLGCISNTIRNDEHL